ncbi:hypothetical protein Bca101_074276 [Brassica carinata]
MNGPWNYALVCGWNDVVKANGLKDVDNISLWSFRCRGVLDEVLKLAECTEERWRCCREAAHEMRQRQRCDRGGHAKARALLSQVS